MKILFEDIISNIPWILNSILVVSSWPIIEKLIKLMKICQLYSKSKIEIESNYSL